MPIHLKVQMNQIIYSIKHTYTHTQLSKNKINLKQNNSLFKAICIKKPIDLDGFAVNSAKYVKENQCQFFHLFFQKREKKRSLLSSFFWRGIFKSLSFFSIGIYLLYSSVFVSAIQRSESAICLHISSLSFLDFLPIQFTTQFIF